MSPEVLIVRRRGRRIWRRVRRLVNVLGWLATIAFVYLALPDPFGAKLGITVVSGNSMLPTYETGDAVVTWRTGDYRLGEPIVYAVPDGEVGAGVFVVHRVVEHEGDAYVTRGDNNDGDDKWRPTDDNVQGKVVARVPYGAFLLRWVTSPLSMAAACGMFTMFAVLTSGRGGGGGRRGPPGGGSRPGRRRAVPDRPVREHALVSRTSALAIAGVVVLVVAPVGSAATLGGLLADDLYSTAQAAALSGDPLDVTQVIDSDDPLEYCATVTVTNTSTHAVTWATTVDVAAEGGTAIASSSGVVTVSFSPTAWKVKGDTANAVLAAGASTEFEYCATRGIDGLTPGTLSVVVDAQPTQYCATVTVTSTSTEWVRWSASIGHATPGLTNPVYWLTAAPADAWGASTVTFSAATGTWVVRGSGEDNSYVRAGTTRTFGWCAAYNVSAGVGSTTSTVAVSFGQESYCATVTVTTTSTDWVRWETVISHTTPGLTSQAYWLAAAPTPSNAQTVSFDAGTGTWVVEGITGNNAVVRADTPRTWSYCAPTAAPSVTQVTISAVVRPNFSAANYCADVTVSTTATDWVRWRATIDHATPGLTATPYWLNAAGATNEATTISFTAGTGAWVLEGMAYNRYIKAGSSVTFGFCAPPSTAVLTDATTTVTSTTTTNNQFCANVTVSTTATDWIAWKATINRTTPGVSAAAYWLTAAPTTLTNVQTQSFTAATGTWVAKGVAHNAFVKAGSPVSWTYCAPIQTGGNTLVDATVSVQVVSSWDTDKYCANVAVSTTSPTPVAWRVTIDHNTPGLTATNRWLTSAPPVNNAQTQSFTAATGTWVLVGMSYNATISASTPITNISFCRQ